MALKLRPIPEKSKGGRPRLEDDTKTVSIHIRVPDYFRDEFATKCDERGLVQAEVVRELLETWIRKELP